MIASRLALGTVQFGIDYGITNAGGRVSPGEVAAILKVANAAGVDLLDTASLYGDSESVLGATAAAGHFAIITKTPKFAGCGSAVEAIALASAAFERSLALLGRASVDGLLFHDADDLLGPWGEALWGAMTQWRAAGRIGRLGCSVYEGEQIDAALDRFALDIVQLPYNALDRRLAEGGQIDRLAKHGVEIHARSIFLQGLLLQDPARIPARFAPVAVAVRAIHQSGEAAGLDPLAAVLTLTMAERRIDRFVLGVTSAGELRSILAARAAGGNANIACPPLPAIHPRYLNPARWHELG